MIWFVVLAIAGVQLYLLLHELGHALAAVSVGGSVTTIDARPWSARPHASYDLAGVSSGQRAFISAGGTLLPLLAWAVAMLVLPRRLRGHVAIARAGASAAILGGLLPWLVLPWSALQASAPSDDTVRFTGASGWPPAVVVALAAAVLVGALALAWWRTGGPREVVTLRRARSFDVTRGDLAVAGAGSAGLTLVAIALYTWAFPGSAAAADVITFPTDAPVADVRLAGEAFDADIGGGVAESDRLFLVLGFEEIDGPIRLVVTDAAQQEHVVAGFGPGTTMGVASSRPRLTLAPGASSLHLTADGTTGRVRAWVEGPETR